jgi:hypothetical protein
LPEESQNAIVTFDSTHHAMAAEDILRLEGIALEVVPPPSNLSAGCGLALRVAVEDIPRVMEAIRSRGAAYAAVHLLDQEQRAVKKLE